MERQGSCPANCLASSYRFLLDLFLGGDSYDVDRSKPNSTYWLCRSCLLYLICSSSVIAIFEDEIVVMTQSYNTCEVGGDVKDLFNEGLNSCG